MTEKDKDNKVQPRLRRRVIRLLSAAELDQVAGGRPAPQTTTDAVRCDTDGGAR